MAVTFRGAQANYDTAQGGVIPSSTRVRDLGAYAPSLLPRKTPLLTRMGKGAPIDVYQPEWGKHNRTPMLLTLGADLGNNGGVAGFTGSDTAVTVGTGQGVHVNRNLVLEITDYYVGSNPPRLNLTTREEIWLPANSSGDVVSGVYRGYAGTTPVAHTSGAQVKILRSAEPQLDTHEIGSQALGATYYNEFERFSDGIQWDRATVNTRTYEFPNGSPREYQIEETTLRLKLQLEQALWSGGRQAGTNVSPKVPSALGGIDQFIVTNRFNFLGAKVTPRSLETQMRTLWKSVDDAAGKTLLMDYDTASIFDGWNQAYKQTDMNNTQVSYLVEKVKFREGIYDIGVSRWCPPQTIYVVNLDDMKYHPRKGNDWTMQKWDGDVHGVAYDKYFIYGDFTFVLQNEEAMAKIYNFTVDPSSYPIY